MLAAVALGLALAAKSPVDWVNPNVGGISHLLVPTYPTVSLPNGMLRVYPNRDSFVASRLSGLPLVVTGHRGGSAFSLSPFAGAAPLAVGRFAYDAEHVCPYRYSVRLEDDAIDVDFAPTRRAAVYRFAFEADGPRTLVLNGGELSLKDGVASGSRPLGNGTRVYLAMAFDAPPQASGSGPALSLTFPKDLKSLSARYGVSFISVEQARKNLDAEIPGFDLERVARAGRDAWNAALGKVEVEGGSDDERSAFYTALYRTYERMVDVSEDGRYFSGFDGKVHEDGGVPFYTDDWSWDTFRAAHPLGVLLNPKAESAKVASYVRMAQQSREGWMPTFPSVHGDEHLMNGAHGVSILWDAYQKGLRGFDLAAGYEACRRAMTDSTMLPWTRGPANRLDAFYKERGYFPALRPGERETEPAVHGFEKRQAVPVSLAASYDAWCLAQIAKALGRTEDAALFAGWARNYRNLYNPATGFFHPKDEAGAFIAPFDYRFSGGIGARDYYDENNGWTYRWDVQHDVAGLVRLMGGPERFVANLDQTFEEPLGRSRYEFYSQLPDQTGNVGQFSMGNEPSLHIPYLYNYAGAPWKTQKRVRSLLEAWFRNDLMGIPGDEDGGGLSAFVVFSSMGFYPVTPGTDAYNIGSPIFRRVTIRLENGKRFTIEARGASHDAKYVRSARLNGFPWNKPWFPYAAALAGGTLELTMGDRPNKAWGAAPQDAPPSGFR